MTGREREREKEILFEKALGSYFDAYMTKRDFHAVQAMAMQTFSGYGTGMDERSYTLEEALGAFRRDIESAPNPLHYTLHRQEIKMVDGHNAFALCEFDLSTVIAQQEIALKNLRMTLIMHEEKGTVKIAGMHISFPTTVHEEGESYPLKELENRASVLRRMVEEETKTLQEAYQDLLGVINTDPLTGLESRASLDQKLKVEHQRFQRFGRPYALIILDLDNLKEVNDTWGHATGDTVLQLVAKAAKDRLRVTDTAARWGGDEFVLLLPETPLEDATGVARDIQEGMTRQQEKNFWDKKSTLSMGISVIRAGESPEILFKRSDAALYKAKRNGKNQIIAIP
ncbi:MAG TPA: diguanylate cyclase [Synergistaceae bacterium]|nr:diguanylate cyclase [Synergistaceae bacterium]HPJ25985.1 diguanylate cyclase [Synergistaceae bacterium]HPQ37191.1 diguanylate cyclase [Synergistaceae bacterium]